MSETADKIEFFTANPGEPGRRAGFKDLTPLHGEGIRETLRSRTR